ncbi:MAG: hypothetical protein HOC77_10440 [Chloroflexi bacterium]|jgi:hypothetical protein|nr:hypothetical protein [Chloroflexota bacterium]MBT4072780.1 hypothetical protein [Chloroflexota bacterium]MBT4515494.1 hypothetical protein [Chloroflexota bacterium]MBT5318882.1 hypothetical protein [Chloroflexota bacterium]MBT6681096.1 hypothetical protein [Chloroflexota bacterium]
MTYDPGFDTFDPEPPEAPRDFTSRVVNAALLNRRTFRDIQEDPTGTAQVYVLVAAAAVAAGIGSIDDPTLAIQNAFLTVAGWLIYSHVAWFMRSYIFDSIHAEASRPNMMRVVGIAYGAGLFRALGIVPGIGELIFALATIWIVVAIAVGLKSTLAFKDYGPVVGIIAIGVLLNFTLSAFVFAFG